MTDSNQNVRIYQRVWRWHFFAGLLVVPFAIILSLSGAIYLFKPQITHYFESGIAERSKASAAERELSLLHSEILARFLDQAGKNKWMSYTLPKEDDLTVEIEAQMAGKPTFFWVDKYSGDILNQAPKSTMLLTFIKKLHGELLGGNIGSLIVELMSSWMIVLIVTGIYLAVKPNGKVSVASQLRELFIPNLFNVSAREFWKKLHRSLGLWVSVVVLILLLSGLPWTQVWGAGFKELQKVMGWDGPGQEWFVTLQSKPKSVEEDSLPIHVGDGSELWELKGDSEYNVTLTSKPKPDLVEGITIDDVVEKIRVFDLPPPIQIRPPKDDHGVWTVRSMTQNRPERFTVHYDRWTGEEIMRIQFSDYHPVKRLASYGIAFHEGALFGWLNQLIGLLAAVGVMVLSISGCIMWWRRKPVGRLGAPSPKVSRRLSPLMVTSIVFLALFLPLMGASLLLILLLDKLYQFMQNLILVNRSPSN